MESLAVLVSLMLLGSALLSIAAIVLAALAGRRPSLQPFAWAVVAATLVVGFWFSTMNGPLATAPLIGGTAGALLMGLRLFQKR